MRLDPNRILLIRPTDPFQDSALLSHTRPMNLAYIAAALRKAGFEPAIADFEITPYSIDRSLRPSHTNPA